MNQILRKGIATCLAFALLLTCIPVKSDAKVKKPALAKKKVTLTVGTKKKVGIKRVTKKTKVKIKQNKASKKIAKVTWKKKQKKLLIKGKKAGTTTIRVRFTKNKKSNTVKLKIRVKKKTTNMQKGFVGKYNGDNITPLKDIYKNYFKVGAAINGSSIDTMALNHKGMTGILQKHFNSTVLSNLMKPEHLLDLEASKKSADGMPVCKFDTCDDALQFCKDNGIQMRGHTLVWHNQTPDWFFYEDFDTSKKLVDAATMEKRMDSYFRQVITHCQEKYPGVIYCWDVVNECVSTDSNSYIVTEGGWKLRASTLKDNDFTHEEAKKNFWYATMGETYVEKAFTYARKYADKDVKLFYNDYNVFVTEKMENIYKMCNELKEKGLIDGIGLQPTVLLNWPALNADYSGSFKTCLKKYAELGLELQITELSFKIEPSSVNNYEVTEDELKAQADRYGEFMQLLLEMDSNNGGPCNITSVTVFGICDDYPLYDDFEQNLYLWDKNCKPKACFYSFAQPGLDLMK